MMQKQAISVIYIVLGCIQAGNFKKRKNNIMTETHCKMDNLKYITADNCIDNRRITVFYF